MRWSLLFIAMMFLTACAQQEAEVFLPAGHEPEPIPEEVPTIVIESMPAEETSSPPPVVKDIPEMKEPEPPVVESTTKEFEVEAFKFGFSPDPITVKKGDSVKITFTSIDGRHGVSMPDFGVSTPEFKEGESHIVEFVANKKGEFTYRCNTYCGSGHNQMTGVLIVE